MSMPVATLLVQDTSTAELTAHFKEYFATLLASSPPLFGIGVRIIDFKADVEESRRIMCEGGLEERDPFWSSFNSERYGAAAEIWLRGEWSLWMKDAIVPLSEAMSIAVSTKLSKQVLLIVAGDVPYRPYSSGRVTEDYATPDQ